MQQQQKQQGKRWRQCSLFLENGLEIPLKHMVDYHKQDDWSSRILYLVAD